MKKKTNKLVACAVWCGFLCASVWSVAALAQEQILNLRDADVRAFVEDVSRATGLTFILAPSVNGKVTVISQDPLDNEELFQVFLSTLRVHGFAAVQTSPGTYRIVPDATTATDGSSSVELGVGGDQFITEVFHLKAADANSALGMIKPLIHSQGLVTASPRGDTLIVADYAGNMQRVREVLAELDKDNSEIVTVRLHNISASEMARIVGELQPSAGEAARRAGQSVVAANNSNSIILRGDRGFVQKMRRVITELDRASASEGNFSVTYLKYADGETLVPILEQVAQHAGGLESGADANVGARAVSIAFHAGTNSLIINGDPEMQRAMATVIRQLDIRRPQVLVEAIIVEVSDTAARELGLQFLLSGTGKNQVPLSVTNFSRSAPNLLALTGALIPTDKVDADISSALQQAAVSSLLGIDGFVGGFAGQTDGGTLFGVILDAVQEDTGSNLLSTPSIMTLDNETASIIVGQEIPVTTGESLGSDNVNPFRTIDRRDVGVQLDVRPQINEGDTIKLYIRQEVSSIFGPVSDNFSELITNKREIETTVLADDGEIIVLGGLIEERDSYKSSKVPLLGDIPFLGKAFQSSGKSKEKTNLMVFLRPTIVRNVKTLRSATDRKFQYMRLEQMNTSGAQDISLDRMVEELLGAPQMEVGVAPSATPEPVN